MSEEEPKKVSRRDFLKVAGLGATEVVLGKLFKKMEKTGGIKKPPESAEGGKEDAPVNIVGVSIPIDEEREITTFALAIDTNALEIRSQDIHIITVECTEPGFAPIGMFRVDSNEQVMEQMELGIKDPSKVEKVGDITRSPAGIIYYPFIEIAQTAHESKINELGIEYISPRNELTGDNPSVPRDFESGTMFKVTIDTPYSSNTYDVGPYQPTP